MLRIDGINSEIKEYVGKPYNSYRLKKAMELARVLRKTGLDEDLNIVSIDTNNIENVIIHI